MVHKHIACVMLWKETKECGQQKRGYSVPLLHSGEIPSAELSPVQGPQHKKDMELLE